MFDLRSKENSSVALRTYVARMRSSSPHASKKRTYVRTEAGEGRAFMVSRRLVKLRVRARDRSRERVASGRARDRVRGRVASGAASESHFPPAPSVLARVRAHVRTYVRAYVRTHGRFYRTYVRTYVRIYYPCSARVRTYVRAHVRLCYHPVALPLSGIFRTLWEKENVQKLFLPFPSKRPPLALQMCPVAGV